MIKQISIFAENQKGTMLKMTGVLVDANINMYSLITNDSAEFGIIRMLVSDTDAALRCMQAAGYLCHVDTVVAAEIRDECGSLNALLETLSRGNVNLDYLYVTYAGGSGPSALSKCPVAILRTQDIMEVEGFLRSKGYNMLERLD